MSFTDPTWHIGDTAHLSVELIDAAGAAIDPDSITLKIKPPSGQLITISTPTHSAPGKFHHDLALDKKGAWYYRWETTAPLPAVAEGSLTVQPSRFVP